MLPEGTDGESSGVCFVMICIVLVLVGLYGEVR